MKRSRETIGFDLTPLIDIVFLLLIFFLVSTVFKKDEQVLGLNLPKTENANGRTQDQPTKKILTVELSTEQLAINGKKISFEEFEQELQALALEAGRPVDVKVDKSVTYDRLVKIFDVLEKFKLTDISLITTSAR